MFTFFVALVVFWVTLIVQWVVSDTLRYGWHMASTQWWFYLRAPWELVLDVIAIVRKARSAK